MLKKTIEDVVVPGVKDLTEEQMKQTVEAYSQNAANYSRMWVWNPQYREDLNSQVRKFHRYVEYGSRVLVPGGGVGRDVEMLVDEGYECTAVDISPEVLEEAKSRGVKAKYLVHDIRKPLPFDDSSFDAVYCDSVLEHIPKKEVAIVLNEFYRVLVPGGIIYAGMKRGEGEVYYRYDVGNEKNRRFYITYSDAEFHELMARSGYVLLERWVEDHMDPRNHQWTSGIFRKK